MSSTLSPLANIQIIHHDLTIIEQRLNDNNFKLVPKKMIAELQQIYPELLSMRHIVKNSENEAISTKAFIVWQRCYQICQGKRIKNLSVKSNHAAQTIEKDKNASLRTLGRVQRKLRLLDIDKNINASQKKSVKEILGDIAYIFNEAEQRRKDCDLFLNALESDSKEVIQKTFVGLSFDTQKVIFDKVFELSNNNNQLLFTPARASSLFEKFDLLTIKNAFYSLMNIKENPSEGTTTDHEFVVPPNLEMTLDNFSNEVLMRIFQAIKQPQDYFRLGLANKHFHAISQTSRAFKCDVVFPSYLAETKDPAIRQLSNFKKVKMAAQVEKKLSSEDPLPILYEVNDLDNPNPIPKKIIGDHLVFMPNSRNYREGMVYIINLKTKDRKVFKVDDFTLRTCEILQTDRPLLVTGANGTFKIWDFNILITLANNDELYKALVYTFNNKIVSNITTHGHLLVGYLLESVRIWDGTKLSSPNCYITINLPDTHINQFQFTDTHLMLVSNLKLFIFGLDTIEQTFGRKNPILEADSSIYNYYLNQQHDAYHRVGQMDVTIKFAKIYGDFVVIAYRHGYTDYSFEECPYTFGEVRNWKTGKRLRMLSHPDKLKQNVSYSSDLDNSDGVDCYNDQLFTGSSYLSGWDLNSKEVLPNTMSQGKIKWSIQRAYVLGHYILFANKDGIGIKDRSLSHVTVRDSLMASTTEGHPEIFLTSFELNGSKLIAETNNTNHKKPNGGSITVYDLASSPEEIESPSQENKLSLLSAIVKKEETEYMLNVAFAGSREMW